MRSRRDVLKAAAGTAVLGGFPLELVAQTDPRNARPQPGDRFVHSGGANKGKPIAPGDVPLGGPYLAAYAQHPQSGVVRDGSRLNEVLLVRLDPQDLSEAARANAPQGYLAFTAICTHGGCSDWAWDNDKKMLKCPCHDSQFDPKDDARVVDGPATRRLPRLPLKIEDGALVVAGTFVGRVGADLT